MSNVLKQQILKPLSRFVKNLSPDKIKLSVFRGEGDLTNLELDEEALMELLDLPTWLCIRKVTCNKVAIKIQWTRLKSQPIIVFLDEVHVEVEALEEPRKPKMNNLPSYRLNEGKYGLIDRVLDGMKVIVNSVRMYFKAATFQASICLDRLTVASRLPNWVDGELKYTFVRDTQSDQILLFKEISWETTRLEADGLKDLQLTPVKLITNACRVRITLKKRLSDSSVISSRVQFVLDELLWVLTVSQLEAAVIFMKSLKKSILRSVEQSKSRVAQTATNTNNIKGRPTSLNHSADSRYQHAEGSRPSTNVARLFDVYDVPETSYHVTVGRVELHFCEENRPDLELGRNAVKNGSIRMVFQRLAFELYPFHVSSVGRGRWRGYEEPNLKRLAWLQDTPTFAVLERNRTAVGNNAANAKRNLLESAVLLRIADFEMTCVSTMRKRQAEPFASSDKRLWHLAPETNTVTLCYTSYYRTDGSSDNVPLPDLYCQLNPCHLRLDIETIVWLNAFYLNVSKNLPQLNETSEWSDVIPRAATTSPDGPAGASEPLLRLFFRVEAIQPRLVLPAEYHISGQPERPHSIQVQASTLILSNVNPDRHGLKTALESHGDALRFYPQQQADVPVQWEDFQAFQSNGTYPINAPPASSPLPVLMFCLKCESVWAEYCGARTPRGTNRPLPLLEEVPVALWLSMRTQSPNDQAAPSPAFSSSSSSATNRGRQAPPRPPPPSQAPAPPPPAPPGPPSYLLSLLLDCGESPISLRVHHYQYLFLLRLSESYLRLVDALSEDYEFVLGTAPPQHSASFAMHLLQTCVNFSLPALSETFTYSASSNQLMRQFMNAATVAAANEAAAAASGDSVTAVSDPEAPTPPSMLAPELGPPGMGLPGAVDEVPPTVVSFPPAVDAVGAQPQRTASPASSSRSASASRQASISGGSGGSKAFTSAFHRLGSSLNRFGDAVKAAAGQGPGSGPGTATHSPVGTDEDGWEKLSLAGSELSDSDEEAKLARLLTQLDFQQQQQQQLQQQQQQQQQGASSQWNQQQQLACRMTTAAIEAAQAPDNEEGEEAEDVMELESVVSSSVVSASRRDHSTVSFVVRRLHCYGGMAVAGSVAAGHLDAVEVRQSGARGRRGEAEVEAAEEAEAEAAAAAAAASMDANGNGNTGELSTRGPLMHFRVDMTPPPDGQQQQQQQSQQKQQQQQPPQQQQPQQQQQQPENEDADAVSNLWTRVRVLRPWSLSMLMSSVTNLMEFLEDEVESAPLPFTCVLEGGLQLVLREDRLCSNLTCPGSHPEMRVALPPGLWVERGRDQTMRLDVRQPLQMQARAAAAAVMEGGVRRNVPSPVSSMSVQTDVCDGPPAALNQNNGGGGAHAPSQELLNLYYTENRKLREKMARLKCSAAESGAALEEARRELHTLRQERDSLYTTLDCLQAELQSQMMPPCVPGRAKR